MTVLKPGQKNLGLLMMEFDSKVCLFRMKNGDTSTMRIIIDRIIHSIHLILKMSLNRYLIKIRLRKNQIIRVVKR
jgi:hypothetical protein